MTIVLPMSTLLILLCMPLTSIMVEMNETLSEMSVYMVSLSELSSLDVMTLTELFNYQPMLLQILHCNVYCNNTAVAQLGPSDCVYYSQPRCRSCRCDGACEHYGDCCPKEGINKSKLTSSHYECIGSSYENKILFTGNYNGYYMKNACSKSQNENISDIIAPVTSLLTNVTYRNKLIAGCSNEYKLAIWKINRVCQRTRYKSYPLECMAYVSPPNDVYVRNCDDSFSKSMLITTCNETGLWDGKSIFENITDHCEKPISDQPVLGGTLVFQNIYCYMCNGLAPAIFGCRNTVRGSWGYPQLKSINSLVDVKTPRMAPTCQVSQWYDNIKNICRWIQCRPGYDLEEQKCVISSSPLRSVRYSFAALFWDIQNGLSSSMLEDWTYLEQIIVDNFPWTFNNFNFSYCLFSVYKLVRIGNVNTTIDLPAFGINMIFMSGANRSRADLETEIEGMFAYSWPFTFNMSKYLFNLTVDNNSLGTLQSSTYKLNTYTKELEIRYAFHDEDIKYSTTHVSFPRSRPMCSHVTLHANDFERNQGGSITLRYADITIQSNNFTHADDHSVLVCVSTLTNAYSHYTIPPNFIKQAEDIVSIIFSILSLICLAVTFITYCSFPSLLTPPTKNTMILVAFLFLAQLILQFGGLAAKDVIACQVLGVFVHFLWLSVFCWMNVCSYHMFHVFVLESAKPISTAKHYRRLCRYAVYASGVPVVIICVTLAVNLTRSAGSNTGYGADGRCYLSTVLLTGLSFILPVSIILVMNVTFFISSICSMAKVHKMGQAVNKSDRNQVHAYLKLSTLTGMFWILSILAENLQIQVLVFLSIILNASQGAFIFFSYIVNTRVYNLWRGKMSIYSPDNSQEHSNSGTHSKTITTHI